MTEDQELIASWLQERMSIAAVEEQLKRRTNHPSWLRLKASVQPDDEIWSFRSPPHTWPAKLGAAGYALVRKGVVIDMFTLMRS